MDAENDTQKVQFMSNSTPMKSRAIFDLKSQKFDGPADHCAGVLRSEGYDIPILTGNSEKKVLMYLGAARPLETLHRV